MKAALFTLSAWLALPLVAWGADGANCTIVPPAGSNETSGIVCRTLCDKQAAGTFQCGPMWVPGGGRNVDLAIIRPLQGTSAAGCGYDDVVVYSLSNTN